MERVDLFIGERAVHVTVIDAEALALTSGLRMHELVNALYSLSEISTDSTHSLEELILIESSRHPESDVFIARRVL